jgi:hypothetical protein
MTLRPTGALVVAGLLGGCVTQAPPRHVALDDAPCVRTIQALQVHPLPVTAERTKVPFMDFADVGQCLLTNSGKITTALFDLRMVRPPARAGITIQANSAATLATAVTLLDSHREPIRRIGFSEFARRGDTFTLDVFVNVSDHDAAYLLLTPDGAWVGKSDVSMRGESSVGTFRYGFETLSTRHLTDAGKLRIELTPQ